ncbi:MAG: formylglycine-generating enzyme family protein [Spirochaetia bacterium]|jgi:formylglycine-generating enzyme required for sulfatase activity|nr:formylglycine-generating enzyme family protein [Spirochaetia bacterium]
MKQKIELPKIEPVKLKPWGPIRPGIYVLVLFILAVALILFLVGFLPGILHGGRTVNFTSELQDVGVSVDGTYISGTPAQSFISSGDHEVTFSKGGIALSTQNIHIDHPVFFTWLVFRYKKVAMEQPQLDASQQLDLRNFDLQQIIDQSAVLDFDRVNNYIPYFLGYAKDAVRLSFSKEDIKQDMEIACAFISSRQMLDDAKNAFDYLGIDGNAYFSAAQSLFNGKDGMKMGKAADESFVPQATDDKLSLGNGVTITGSRLAAASYLMGDKVSASYPTTNSLGMETQVPAFSLAQLPVSEYQYALFVQDNPEWAKENRTKLMEEELVDENYLAGISLSVSQPNLTAIRNISFKAAKAFCAWASKKSGRTCFLPTEEMWEEASYLNQSNFALSLVNLDDSNARFKMMMGGVWEMTSTPYVPLARLVPANKSTLEGELADRSLACDYIVKGGSVLDDSVSRHTVGAVGPTRLNPTLGFRLAWQ